MKSSADKKKQQADEKPKSAAAKKEEEKNSQQLEIILSSGIHEASSESWGDGACARLFSHIIESNNGRAQQIIENKTYFLEYSSLAELSEKDDLGLTLQFVAVYHDRPEMLRYLQNRGIDLSKFRISIIK